MKFIVTLSFWLFGTGNGWSGPGGHVVCDLLWRQLAHDGMYNCSKSRCMFGQ